MGAPDTIKQGYDAYQAQQDAETKKYLEALKKQQAMSAQGYANLINGTQQIQKQQDEAYQNQLDNWNTQLQNAEQQQRDVTRLEGQKSIFGAATEFAQALANLHYVGNGASNQQVKNLSQDWMKQVDANREKRKARIDNIRERQRAAEMQLAQLRAGNAQQMNQILYNVDKDRLDRQGELDKATYNAGMQRAQTALQSAQQVASAQAQEAQQKEREREFNANLAMDRKKLVASMAAKGIKPNGDGWEFDSDSYAKQVMAASGAPKNSKPIISGYDVDGNPVVRYGDPLSVSREIKKFIDSGKVTDLDEEGKRILEEIKSATAGDFSGKGSKSNDEVAKRFSALVGHSAAIDALVNQMTWGYANGAADSGSTDTQDTQDNDTRRNDNPIYWPASAFKTGNGTASKAGNDPTGGLEDIFG